ncbi:MAG: hypothetical protein CVU62_08145 [Deltaproteobacteria bacterium HGW-Deltaproteobacteria-2]|jgi:nucleoid-associated protein YgaU|nr:MAG: hypothetical protein CVU62_08145 [Deltaproteobacteria bacterium HGW-Deltaproteobacteria-2]
MQKTKIIIYALIVFLLLPSIIFAETQEMKGHKVVKGDTLWDITQTELNDPFLWPKVWKENPWIKNPHWIYPDQIIKIPLYLIQKGKSEEEATTKPTAASQEPAIVADQRYKGIEEKTTPKPTAASQEPAIVADQQYKGIKGIVLYDGTAIEGQILFMSADIVKIRTKDGNTSSYSFIKEVQFFIKE